MKKRLVSILFLFLLAVPLTSCSRTTLLDFTTSRDDRQYREMVDKVLMALDNKNKEQLKKLFAESVIKTDSDLDNQINALFEYYKGPKESDQGVGATQTNEDSEYGKKKIELNGCFTVQASGVKHNVYLAMQSFNDFDKSQKGIHKLEFATDEAKNSKYFMWHTQEGIHIQTSSEKRNDVAKVESWMLDYTFVDRHFSSDDYVALVKKDNDFEHFTASVGVANCSNSAYNRSYYELGNNLFLVCIVELGKIEFVKLTNEDEIFSTLWIAPDRIMVEGEYRQYTPIKRKTAVNEDFFKTFFKRSNELNELINEIGLPNGENNNLFFKYYKVSDNQFVVCEGHADGKTIVGAYIADSKHKLYSIWEADDNNKAAPSN
jgi:hypothetical protein